jgi:carbonic anhydrase
MKIRTTLLLLITIFFVGYAYDGHAASKAEKMKPDAMKDGKNNMEDVVVKQFLTNIFKYNKKFAASYDHQSKDAYLKKQTPLVTLVACSDSRVSTESFGETDINNIFVIRNIGNQLETAEGSIEYGVKHLHTKILVFLGHTECGAVDASMKDTRGLSSKLKKELSSLNTSDKSSLNDNIIANIDHQVEKASIKFKDQVEKGELLILGILYDLHNHLGGGNHRIYISNVNGIQDEKVISSEGWLKNIPNVKILQQKYHTLQ